ncbi:MAG: hypothetical protein ACK46L_14755 [Synechococcaceae cyanobacterium]
MLERLISVFRKRFKVPEDVVDIAVPTIPECHHDWIEAFLVSHREVRLADQRQGNAS